MNKRNSFDLNIFIPVIVIVKARRYAISPIDRKNKSEIKLPWNPKIFCISALSGKIKFGSEGEYVNNAINISIPEKKKYYSKDFCQSFNSKIN